MSKKRIQMVLSKGSEETLYENIKRPELFQWILERMRGDISDEAISEWVFKNFVESSGDFVDKAAFASQPIIIEAFLLSKELYHLIEGLVPEEPIAFKGFLDDFYLVETDFGFTEFSIRQEWVHHEDKVYEYIQYEGDKIRTVVE